MKPMTPTPSAKPLRGACNNLCKRLTGNVMVNKTELSRKPDNDAHSLYGKLSTREIHSQPAIAPSTRNFFLFNNYNTRPKHFALWHKHCFYAGRQAMLQQFR
jgi:hypothetical protein